MATADAHTTHPHPHPYTNLGAPVYVWGMAYLLALVISSFIA